MAGHSKDNPSPEVQSLPKELHTAGRALQEAVPQSPLLAQAFATFCSAAYVKPEWAGPASDFIAELFTDHEDLLADMARIPDLIIELASGHYALTFMVASRWAAKNDTARLVRLAEALVATQSKMSGSEVVDIMLALTTSLAITRYPRAEQLLGAAEPNAREEHREAIAEARVWLAAGRVVRLSSQDARDLWDQRLRRSRTPWTWETREEREALSQLANHLDVTMEGADLFKAVVPACWWDLAVMRVREAAQHDAAQAAKEAAASQETTFLPQVGPRSPRESPPPVVVWNALPCVLGGLSVALALAGVLWLGPYDIVKNPARRPVVANRDPAPTPAPAPKTPAEAATPPAPGSAATPGPAPDSAAMAAAAAPPGSPEGFTAVTPPDTPAPPTVSTIPTAQAALPDLSPEDQAKADAQTQWRKEQAATLAAELPGMASIVEMVKTSTWPQNEAILLGQTEDLPKDDPGYQKLLVWLHLDPPADPETRAKIPGLIADLRQETELLDLWKKLVYRGSPNAQDIQATAKRQIHENATLWSPSQKLTLAEIAGWAK